MSCGSTERPEATMANQQALNAVGIDNVAYVSPETTHGWLTWRRNLDEFALLPFKD